MCRTVRMLVATAAVLAASVPVSAAKRVGAGSTILINTQSRRITDASTKEVTPLLDAKAGKNEFEIRSDDKLVLAIEDYNPFLFTYTFKAGTPTDTPDYLAALEVARRLATLVTRFGLSAKAKGAVFDGFTPADFREQIAGIAGHVRKLPELIGLSIGTAGDVARLKGIPVEEEWEKDIKAVEDGYAAIATLLKQCGEQTAQVRSDDGLTVSCDEPFDWAVSDDRMTHERKVAEAKSAVDASRTLLAIHDATLKTARSGAGTKPTKEMLGLITKLETAFTNADNDLKEKVALLAKNEKERDEARAKRANETLRQFLRAMTDQKTDVEQQLALLRDFLKDLAQLHVETNIEQITYSIQNKPGTLTLTARTRYDSVMNTATKTFRTSRAGDYAFELHPYQPARLRVGAAAVMGLFIKNPTFTALKDGDAFVIKRTDEEPAIFKVAAMFNITPISWNEPTFGGYFQLGITPDPDNIGLYFGGGIRAQSVFSFGAGLMLQQVRILGEGLTMDSRLDDPAKLETDSEFRPGLYFHFTVSLPK